jgi:hypothetical protein
MFRFVAYNNFDRPFNVVFLSFGCYLKLSTEKGRLKSIWFYLNDMSCYSDQFPT